MTEYSTIALTIADHVAAIRLDRPDKRNAIDDDMFDELARAAEGLVDERSLRAVVLHGAGSAFCAGLDLALFRTFADESDAGERPFGDPGRPGSGRRQPGRGQRIVHAIRRIPVPVIAAIHGPAVGAGLQLALAADIRLVGPDGRLATREIEYGITLDMGGSQLLPRLIGADRALEMIVTGRMVGADEAVRIGLATSAADDPVAAAFELAATIASRNPEAVADSKRLVRLSESSPVDVAMPLELQLMAANIGRPNQVEAVRASQERRRPVFDDRG